MGAVPNVRHGDTRDRGVDRGGTVAWGRLFGVSCGHAKCWAVGDNGVILTN